MPVKFGPEGFTSTTLRRFLQQKPPQTEEIYVNETPRTKGTRALRTLLIVGLIVGGAYYLARANFSLATSTAPGKIQNKREYPQPKGGMERYIEVLIREPSGNHYRVEMDCDDKTWNEFEVNQEVIVHYTGGSSLDSTIVRLEPKPTPVEL